MTCAVNGCDRPVRTRGWCHPHYTRWRRTGSPTPPARDERFWAKVDASDDCWGWNGYRTVDGYGIFWGDDRKHVKAHRFAYELLVGPIPDDLTIDHLCRNPSCVNPAHMEPVTRDENTRRARAAKEAA